jgi:U32 family peptidase
MHTQPELLAPAGDTNAFLAALAAGADAVYVGLKHYSARMQADNFSVKDLYRCRELAAKKNAKLYVAFNALLKPGDLDAAGRLLQRLVRHVQPQGLIVQDLACLDLARQAGYEGELHLSTLANCSHPAGLELAARMGASRVVLPRELNIDEIKLMAAACPPGLDLEVFIHGALCFCVSGRCYWSSYLGGKSGLRGRCVQPCRRVYTQKGRRTRFFSCQDLGLDVLVKALRDVPQVAAWKIEGRKKGPHYVYYTVAGYKLLRDQGDDPQTRKRALEIFEQALGRPGTHYFFLPQRQHSPVSAAAPDAPESGSGLFAGRVTKTPEGQPFLRPKLPLLPQDLLRVGNEDEPWHRTLPLRKAIPKGGRLDIPLKGKRPPKSGTPVFLVDRREPELQRLLAQLHRELEAVRPPKGMDQAPDFAPRLPRALGKREKARGMTVLRTLPQGKAGKLPGDTGIWLHEGVLKTMSRTLYPKFWWWLPPVLWPDEEVFWRNMLGRFIAQGARRFVCNQPWQVALFEQPEKLELTAGPFCNAANALALEALAGLGFSRAVVSPELEKAEFLALPGQSPIALGVVLAGEWPVGVSRVHPEAVKTLTPFTSPMKEHFWSRKYGPNLWIYPGWPLDLGDKRQELEDAGYSLFVRFTELRPKDLVEPQRTSTFNWDLQLL